MSVPSRKFLFAIACVEICECESERRENNTHQLEGFGNLEPRKQRKDALRICFAAVTGDTLRHGTLQPVAQLSSPHNNLHIVIMC